MLVVRIIPIDRPLLQLPVPADLSDAAALVPEAGWEHALHTVWEDGALVSDQTLAEIRDRAFAALTH